MCARADPRRNRTAPRYVPPGRQDREGGSADADPQPGMTLNAQQDDGQPMQLVIVDVKDDSVRADANHPLAGEDLVFGLTVVDIKKAA